MAECTTQPLDYHSCSFLLLWLQVNYNSIFLSMIIFKKVYNVYFRSIFFFTVCVVLNIVRCYTFKMAIWIFFVFKCWVKILNRLWSFWKTNECLCSEEMKQPRGGSFQWVFLLVGRHGAVLSCFLRSLLFLNAIYFIDRLLSYDAAMMW